MPSYQTRGSQLNFSAGSLSDNEGLVRITGLYDGGFAASWTGADTDRTAFDGDLFGLHFDKNLVATSGSARTFITDSGPSNSYPVNQAITGLKTNGTAVIAIDNGAYPANQAGSNRDAVIRLYNADGTQNGQPINLGTASLLGATAATLTDGRVVAGWIDTTGAVRAQYLDSKGSLVGQSFQVALPAGDSGARPGFAALEGGGWVATYVTLNGGAGRAVFYNAQGVAGLEVSVAPSVTNLLGVQAAGLSNGNAVLIWSETVNNNVETRARIYSQTGSALSGTLSVSSTATSVASVTALLDGSYAIALELETGASEVRIFNSAGALSGSPITIPNATDPTISRLADGGFVIAWEQAGTDTFFAQAYELVPESAPAQIGNGADNTLIGDSRSDTLVGLAGNDILIGGAGLANTLQGGTGNDLYFVAANDTVFELSGEGTDQVRTALSRLVLSANVENLTYIGAGNFNGVGNALDNVIVGGNLANNLDGGDGNDTLVGGAERDILIGGNGSNTLQGGGGDDLYFLTNRFDTIVEAADGGTDQVRTTSNFYALNNNVENLSFIGTGAFAAVGSAVANVIVGGGQDDSLDGGDGADILVGGAGADVLIGGGGNNTLQGGAGNDLYFVSSTGDSIVEINGEGIDQVRASAASHTLAANVENLTYIGGGAFVGTGNGLGNIIQGGALADTLSGLGGDDALAGGDGADTLLGGDGADTLNGGLGLDILTGGAGADIFLFDTALAASNIDSITDLDVSVDRIFLDRSIFTAIGVGQLSADAFATGASATGTSTRIVYNSASGGLFYDQDGTGAAAQIQFATLGAGLNVSASNFVGIGVAPGMSDAGLLNPFESAGHSAFTIA